jgi:hypothetical protein
MSSPDSLRPMSRTASSLVWGAEPGSFKIPGNKEKNERFPAPGNMEKDPVSVPPAQVHQTSNINIFSNDSPDSLAETENTDRGMILSQSSVNASMNLADRQVRVENKDQEDQDITETPGNDVFKVNSNFKEVDASESFEGTINQQEKKRIKIETAGEILPGDARAGHIIKNDLEPLKLPSEKPLKKRIPDDAYTESDKNMIPGSARTDKLEILENIYKAKDSMSESHKKQMSELNPVKPTLPIREMPSIVQSKLVIGKLTVEVINPPEEKAPSVQVKEINNYIPVPATPPSDSFSSGIKVKYGIGQL